MNFDISAFLIRLGIIILIIGIIIQWLPAFRLPGDIILQGKQYKIYIPIVTSIILSLIITIVLNVLLRLQR